MKSNFTCSLDVDLAIKAKEHAQIRGVSFSRLLSISLVEEIERYEALPPEMKAEALVSVPGRRALSTEEFAQRAFERQKAIKELRRKGKELVKGKTIYEMEEDDPSIKVEKKPKKKKDPFLSEIDEDPELLELERQMNQRPFGEVK